MSWFRAPLRLVDDPAQRGAPLGAALRDWSLEHGDAQAVARLELQLGAALAKPRVAPRELSTPACLFGLWAVTVLIALTLAWHEGPRAEREVPARLAPHAAMGSLSKREIASRLGVGPRELASQEAMDALRH